MIPCQELRDKIHLYVDGELAPSDVMAVEAHLLDCGKCAAEYDSLRYVIDTVRGARPLYDVPPAVLEQTRSAVSKHRGPRLGWLPLTAAATLVLAGIIGFVPHPRSVSGKFTAFAAGTHLRYAKGLLPLDVASSQPEVVNAWLEKRMPFRLVLPNYPSPVEGGKPYRLSGARLVQFGGDDAAYVAYEMNERPISLLIASAAGVSPAGGEIVRSGNLTFHFERQSGLQTIAWTEGALTYALVSDLEEGAARSCVVCHGSAADRRKFENLRR